MLMKFVVINPGIVVMLKSEMASLFIQGDKSYIAWSVMKVTHQHDLSTERDRHLKTDRHLHRKIIVYFRIHIIRDLKIRRRRVSTTAAVSWGEWGEVAVVWREKLTLRSTVEEADGFITSFRGLSVF